MPLDPQYKADFIAAGKIAKQVLDYGKSLVVKGASYNQIIKKINEKILELGAKPAFPPQMALNDTAAHFLPQVDQDIILSDELIKLDIGVHVNGAIGDTATTIDLSGKYQHIIDAAKSALEAAQKTVKVGATLGQIGRAIQDEITSRGLSPIRNLSGHGLGKFEVHQSPTIPNYDNGSDVTIKPGMTFAIEPFATNGAGSIYDAGNATIFSFANARPVRSPIARECLKKIKEYGTLPFCAHDLVSSDFSLSKVKLGLIELFRAGIITDHAPLIEEAHGMVAQAENSILVDDDGKVYITTQ